MADAVLRVVEARRTGLALSLLLGAGAATGQAPLGWAWITLAVFAVAISLFAGIPDWRLAAWRGWAFGTGYFAAALFWIVEPFMVDVARHGWMAPFALFFMAGGLALFWAAAFGFAFALARGRRGRILLLVAFLTGAEMLRSVVLTGFPWALIGHVWIGSPQMQAAALAGAPGLTLLTLFAASLPALSGATRAALGVISAAALMSVPVVFAMLRVPPSPAPPVQSNVVVRLVQPNAPQHLKWDPEMVPVYYKRQIGYTKAPPGIGSDPPDIVIWPETAIPYLIENAGRSFAEISDAARGGRVVLGVQRRDEEGRWFNSLVALDQDGGVGALYDKHHLVPFGEYMPLMGVFAEMGVFGLAANDTGGYHAGPGPELIGLDGAGRALPLICYEAIFANDIARAPARPDWLIQVTNDAWFGTLAGPHQHLALARLRSVELGVPLFRSANTGVSAAFDPYGRELAGVPLGQEGFVDALLPAPLPPTVYARFGDWPVLVFLVLLAFLATVSDRRRPAG